MSSRRKPHHAGICHGIQSQLEHVDHWRTTTQDEAIQWFQHKAAWNDGAAQAAAASSSSPDDSGGASAAEAHALQTVHVSNVLVYPTTTTTTKTSSTASQSTPSPPSQEEEWSCYGTTEVDLLVLRPLKSKEETIAAVSPYCSPGMTIRDVILPDSSNTNTIKDRTSTIRLGVVEILYQTSMEEDDEDEQEEEEEIQEVTASSSTKADDSNTSKDSATVATDDKPKTRKTRRKKTRSGDISDDGEEQEQQHLGFPTRFWNSGQSVWKHMQINAHLLYQATQEDFTNRTWEAMHKIVQEFPKTRDRTLELMRKVIFWDWSSPSDEDGGDSSSGGGGGPPPPPMT